MSSAPFELARAPFTHVLAMVTNRCNLECGHCFVSSGPREPRGLPASLVVDVGTRLHQRLGSLEFSVSGGEPLVRAEDTLRIMESLENLHRVTLLTNGTRITRDIARRLVRHNCRIRISLDGAGATAHDAMRGESAFKRAMRGAWELRDAGFRSDQLEFYSTITPLSLGDVGGIMDLADDLGVRHLLFNAVAPTGRGATLAESFAPHAHADSYEASVTTSAQAKEWKVVRFNGYPFSVLTIYSNGDVFPFTFVNPDDDGIYGRLGNVTEQDILDLLDSDALSTAILTKTYALVRSPTRIIRQIGVYKGESFSGTRRWARSVAVEHVAGESPCLAG